MALLEQDLESRNLPARDLLWLPTETEVIGLSLFNVLNSPGSVVGSHRNF